MKANSDNGVEARLKSGQRVFGRAIFIILVLVAATFLVVGPSTRVARAAGTVQNSIAADASSDATGILSAGGVLSWTHTPSSSNLVSLVTLACAAHNTGVSVSATYGGVPMSTAWYGLQNSNMFIALQALSNPPLGPQTVALTLQGVSGATYVECSATTWIGAGAVDTSIQNYAQGMSGSTTAIALNPKSTVPANEVFLGAISRYTPGGTPTAPTLSLASAGATASFVDLNLNVGNGNGDACQTPVSGWDLCINTAQLQPGGTSMTFSWSTSDPGYALVMGFGVKALIKGWTGWDGNGNDVIYMTTGIPSTTPYYLPAESASQIQTTQGEQNAINLMVNRNWNTSSSDALFVNEYQAAPQTANSYMLVYVPVAAAGSGNNYAPPGLSTQYWVAFQYVSLTSTNLASAGTVNILPGYDSGINVTGTLETTGLTRDQGLVDEGINALCSFAPGTVGQVIGWACGGWNAENGWDQVAGLDAYSLGLSGSGTVYLHYQTTKYTYPVASQMYVEVHIPYSQFTTTPYPSFTVSGSNIVKGQGWTTDGYPISLGSWTSSTQSITIPAVPALTIAGQVTTALGGAAPGATVNIEATSGSQSGTDYQVQADSGGNYRFFAQVGSTYNVWATYGTAGASAVYAVSASSSAGSTTVNPVIPVVQGTVYSAGAVLPNEAVSFYDGSHLSTVNTNSQGTFVFYASAGTTYTETASVGTTFGNAQATQTVTVGTSQTPSPVPGSLTLPVSYVKGTVYAYSGGGVYNAKVTVTSPSGYQTYVCTDSSGNYFFYTNGAGTYTYNSIGSYSYAQAGPYSYTFNVNTVYSGYSFTLQSGSSTGCGSPPGGGGGCSSCLKTCCPVVAVGGTLRLQSSFTTAYWAEMD